MEIKKNHNKYQIYYRCPNFPKTIYESFDSLKKQIFVPHKLSSTRKAVFGYRILPSPKSHTFSGIYQLCIHPFSPVHVTAANPQRTYNTLTTHLQHTYNTLTTHFQRTVMRWKCVAPLLYVHIVLQSPFLFVSLILIICRVNQN